VELIRRVITVLGLAAALAIPVTAAAAPVSYQWNHSWQHRGSGVSYSPTFHVTDADIHWLMGWRCPVGHYGMHVDLEVYRRGVGLPDVFIEKWRYIAKVYAYNPPNHNSGAVIARNVERIHYYRDSYPWRFSFHAARECHYEMQAEWN
jgi:hypothetical protein